MQKAIRFVGELIPGFVLALAIATVAYFLPPRFRWARTCTARLR